MQHACNISRAATCRRQASLGSYASLAAPSYMAWPQQAWLVCSELLGRATGFSHLAKGLELQLGAWAAIFSISPIQPQNQ
eukprot:280840-Pelagomonas_calceolata.AAC.5